MTDWRSRAKPVTPPPNDPLAASRAAVQARNAQGIQNPNQTLPTAPLNVGAGNPVDWRSRAKPVTATAPATDWRSRAKPLAAEPPKAKNFLERVGDDFARRDANIEDSIQGYARGEQGLPSTVTQGVLQNAAKFSDVVGEGIVSGLRATEKYVMPNTGRHVRNAASGIASALGGLPSFSGRTLAEDVPGEVEALAKAHPTTTRNIKAGVAGAEIVGALTAVKAGAKGVKALTAKDTLTAKDLGRLSTEAYDEAAYLGAKFKPKDVADPVAAEVRRLKPAPAATGMRLSEEDKIFTKALKDFEGLKGKPLDLEGVQKLDTMLTNKITAKFIDTTTGQPNSYGRLLQGLQRKLRDTVDGIKEPGNAALVNGRNFWAAKRRVEDLDAIAERAALSTNPEAARLGYAALYRDKEALRGWPTEAKELLRKAATPGVTAEAMSVITSRLPALIMGSTGNIPAAATAHVVGMAGRGARASVHAKRGAKIQQALVNDALRKQRPVSIPAPETPVTKLLAAPDKMSRLPITDEGAAVARAAIKPRNVGEALSGPPIRTPVSQATKLADSLGRGKKVELKNLTKMLSAGAISVNKFTQAAIAEFGLNTAQARALAKEIKTYLKDESGSTSIENATGGLARQLTARGIAEKKDYKDKYRTIVPPEFVGDKGYVSRVYEGKESGVANRHFDNPKYYSHVRFTDALDDSHGDKGTRYVHEIQSDLHGAGTKYIGGEDEPLSLEFHLSNVAEEIADKVGRDIEDYGPNLRTLLSDHLDSQRPISAEELLTLTGINDQRTLKAIEEAVRKEITSMKPRTEFMEKDDRWLRKTLNKLIDESLEEGIIKLHIDIKGHKNLMRAVGVNKWYGNTVKPTLEKISRHRNFPYRVDQNGDVVIELRPVEGSKK